MSVHRGDQQGTELRKRRTGALRTAWVLAAIALLIFLAFILSGVLGQPQGG